MKILERLKYLVTPPPPVRESFGPNDRIMLIIGRHPTTMKALTDAWNECGGNEDEDHTCHPSNGECWGAIRQTLAMAFFKFEMGCELSDGEREILGRYVKNC